MISVERKKELFKFGIVMSIPFTIFAALFFWKERPAAPYFAGVALFFLGFGLYYPAILSPIHKVWMKFAQVISWIMNRVILTVAYFVIVTPIGLIMRMLGKDLLNRKFDSSISTYWRPVDAEGPCSRPEKPF